MGRGSTKLCPLSTLPSHLPVPVPAVDLLCFPSISCGLGPGTALVRLTSRQDGNLGQEPPSLSTWGGDTAPLTHLWWHQVHRMGLLRHPAVLPGARGPGQRSALGLFPKDSSTQRPGPSQTSVGGREGRLRRNFFLRNMGKGKIRENGPRPCWKLCLLKRKKRPAFVSVPPWRHSV